MAYLVGKFFQYKQNPETLYVHGHLQEPIKYRLETDREEGGPGLPVTIAASKINSYVLGYSGFATGYTFASTALNGVAHLLPVSPEFQSERLAVMNHILDSLIPGRSKNIRDLGDDVHYVSIIKIDVKEKKSHTHGISAALGIEMKKDIDDEHVRKNYWEGAIPVWQTYGDPIPGEHNKVSTPPSYLTTFIDKQNKENKQHAKDVASAKWPYDPTRY